MYLSNCRLQQVNRTRNLDAPGPECGENSPEFGSSRVTQREQKPRNTLALWLLLVGRAAGINGSRCVDRERVPQLYRAQPHGIAPSVSLTERAIRTTRC